MEHTFCPFVSSWLLLFSSLKIEAMMCLLILAKHSSRKKKHQNPRDAVYVRTSQISEIQGHFKDTWLSFILNDALVNKNEVPWCLMWKNRVYYYCECEKRSIYHFSVFWLISSVKKVAYEYSLIYSRFIFISKCFKISRRTQRSWGLWALFSQIAWILSSYKLTSDLFKNKRMTLVPFNWLKYRPYGVFTNFSVYYLL